MATPKFNSKSPTIKRILKEAAELANSPSPDFHAGPASDDDIFDWHFTLRGPPSSAFANGIYHGRIVLPPTYPLRPPSFRFLTPSGRFEVNREICLSISGHHEETWMPAWGVRTALVALRSFMETNAKGQLGGLECSQSEREKIAQGTSGWRCGICGRSNGDILKETEEAAKATEEKNGKKVEETIPDELKMGYKDEMEGKKPADSADDVEAAELAEGFVETVDGAGDSNSTLHPAPVPAVAASLSAPPDCPPIEPSTAAASYASARPGQTVPQPTAAVAGARVARADPQVVPHRSNDGVPVWVDRVIAAIVCCLVAMILKVMLGF